MYGTSSFFTLLNPEQFWSALRSSTLHGKVLFALPAPCPAGGCHGNTVVSTHSPLPAADSASLLCEEVMIYSQINHSLLQILLKNGLLVV